jgi:hypothetical protein
MTRAVRLLIGVLVFAWPSTAFAQRCQGTTPIDRAHRGWAGGGFSNDVTGVSGAGGTRLALLQLDLNHAKFNELEGVTETSVGGKVGVQFDPLGDGVTAVCPFVQIARGHRSDDSLPALKSTRTNVGGGVAFGVAAASTADLDLVPFLALSIVRSRLTAGDDVSATGTEAELVLGVGLVLRDRLTIRPAITRTMSGPDSGMTALGLSAMVGF